MPEPPPPSPANSEWLTRKQIIDGKLREAGWRIVPFRDTQSPTTAPPSKSTPPPQVQPTTH
jgi:hypothetical protein